MKHDYKYMDPKRKAAVTYTFCYRSMGRQNHYAIDMQSEKLTSSQTP